MCPRTIAARALFLASTLLLPAAGAAQREPVPMHRVEGGIYRPVYPPSPREREIAVAPFLLDERPVTNGEFLRFVLRHERWRRDRLPRLFADATYLAHWASPIRLGPEAPADAPVVRVSWFAAKAYCEAQGKRLPTEAEWEYAAAADATRADARQDPAFVHRLLAWYSRPTPKVLPPAGRGEPNLWGVRDLHGLVWEWVSDFHGTLVGTDARAGDDGDRLQFCGAGAVSARNVNDYAAFMRVAFRSSLQASFTTGNLGFRCARDLEEER